MSEEPGLGRRILRETARFAALQVLGAGLVWASTIALTRLLEPRAFGVYAVGSFFLGLGTLLGDGGLGATLLRKRGAILDDEYRVTVTYLLLLGGSMATALLALAPLLARRYHLTADEAVLLRAMAPLFLVGPLRAVPYIRMERELRFARIARIELAATLVRQLTAIVLAALKGGAWALAGASLASALVQLTLAYGASPGFPGLSLSLRTFRPLIAYGAKVQALAIAAFFKDNISAVLLGAVLGPHAVGVFDFGVRYAQVPVLAVNALGRVQLPVYARLDARDPTLFDALRGATRTALVLGIPLLVALAVAAPRVIPFVYAPRWLEATPVVYGLLANMVGGLLAGPLFALLQGQGHAGRAVGVFTVWTSATWILALATWRLGLGALAAAHSVVTVVVVGYLLVWARRHLGRSLRPAYAGPFFAGASALATALALTHLAATPRALRHPLAAAGIALAVYFLALLALERGRAFVELAGLLRALRPRSEAAAQRAAPPAGPSP